MKTKNLFRVWLTKLGLSETGIKRASKIKPGMFVYADGLISKKLILDRQIKAVVGYVENNIAYAVCLHQTHLPWSSRHIKIKAMKNTTDGKKSTLKILKDAQKIRRKAEAAQWCYDYAQNGVQRGEAYLPSVVEWEKFYNNKAAVNISLEKLNAVELCGPYWSSTVHIYSVPWKFDMSEGHRFFYIMHNYDFCVRPIIAIKI